MTPKQWRIIEADLQTLFSVRALLEPSFETWTKLGLFHPRLTVENGEIPLSPVGVASLRRVTGLMVAIPEVRKCCSEREIAQEVMERYNAWIERRLQPTAQEFVTELTEVLLASVKVHEFLMLLDGIDLVDQDLVDLGSVKIRRSDRQMLKGVQLGGLLEPEWVYGHFKEGYWLTGSVRGSPEVALQTFEHRALLTVGLLAICGALLYKGAIWRSHVRIGSGRRATPLLCWEQGGDNPHLRSSERAQQPLPLNAESFGYLRRVCFLDSLAHLLEEEERTEIQDAIVRALYWFGDAHGDQNPIMRFIKLWSCAECFFATDKEDVTEANARGIATILAFAGYRIIEPKDYSKFKRRLKSLYDLRSRAVHRAEFGTLRISDLEEFSNWIAWLVISMAALTERGYRTLSAVKEQASRLDALSCKPNG